MVDLNSFLFCTFNVWYSNLHLATCTLQYLHWNMIICQEQTWAIEHKEPAKMESLCPFSFNCVLLLPRQGVKPLARWPFISVKIFLCWSTENKSVTRNILTPKTIDIKAPLQCWIKHESLLVQQPRFHGQGHCAQVDNLSVNGLMKPSEAKEN